MVPFGIIALFLLIYSIIKQEFVALFVVSVFIIYFLFYIWALYYTPTEKLLAIWNLYIIPSFLLLCFLLIRPTHVFFIASSSIVFFVLLGLILHKLGLDFAIVKSANGKAVIIGVVLAVFGEMIIGMLFPPELNVDMITFLTFLVSYLIAILIVAKILGGHEILFRKVGKLSLIDLRKTLKKLSS